MFKKISLYFSYHFFYLLGLLICFVLPLGLFFEFSSYPLPNIQYVVLACLFISQYAFYNEKNYRRRINSRVAEQLKRELKKIPSINEVNQRETFLVNCRGGSIIFTGTLILIIMIYYKQF